MSALGLIAWALALYALLFVTGAGWAIALLGRRFAPHWPAASVTVATALLVVVTDAPAFFLGARAWSWPLLALALVSSIALAVRHRDRLKRGRWAFALVTVPALLAGLWPQLAEGLATTLSRGNHDYAFYQALAQSLLVRGYGSGDVDALSAVDTTAFVLRHGGWRSGITHLSAWLAAITGRPVYEIDGPLWAGLYAALPGAALVAHGFLRPRASRAARLLVALSALLASPALMLLRDTFASQLASLPLLLVLAAALFRGLASRARGLHALAVLTLGASLSVLADGAPLLVVLLGVMALTLARGHRTARWRILDRAVGIGALGAAVVPFMVVRILWQLQSLRLTGYVGARGGSAGGKDALAGDLLQLLPPLFGVGTKPLLSLRHEHVLVALAVVLALLAAMVLLVRLRRLHGPPAAFALTAALTYLAVLGVLQFTDQHYPAWKAALSASVFVPVLLGVAVDLAGSKRIAAALAAVYLVGLGAILTSDELTLPPTAGIRREQLELARRLERLPGELFLVGNLGSERTLKWELPLQLLLSASGRHLHHTPHPFSYFTTGVRGLFPTHDGRPEHAVVLSSAEADVEGPLQWQTGPVEVRDISGPKGRALNFGFIYGWYDAEREPERRFRWSRAASTVLADFRGKGCWVFEARALVPKANLVVTYGGTQLVLELTHEWKKYRVPSSAWNTAYVELRYEGPVQLIEGDVRKLRFALAEPHWSAGCTEQ